MAEVSSSSVTPDPFQHATCFPVTENLDDFGDHGENNGNDDDDATIPTSNRTSDKSQSISIDFHDDFVDSNDVATFPEKALNDDEAELMRWHLRLGHAS